MGHFIFRSYLALNFSFKLVLKLTSKFQFKTGLKPDQV